MSAEEVVIESIHRVVATLQALFAGLVTRRPLLPCSIASAFHGIRRHTEITQCPPLRKARLFASREKSLGMEMNALCGRNETLAIVWQETVRRPDHAQYRTQHCEGVMKTWSRLSGRYVLFVLRHSGEAVHLL